jgi:pyruvate dehydrogenase (quinone)
MADPNIPPLPPHTSAKQARDYLLALIKGDPDAMKIIRASAKQLFA